MRFELTTLTLARLCSTPELRPRPWVWGRYKQRDGLAREKCAGPEVFAHRVRVVGRYRLRSALGAGLRLGGVGLARVPGGTIRALPVSRNGRCR